MEIIGRFTLVKNKYANTNRCINFKTKEREDELIAQFPHKTFDSNFFTQDGDSILLPLSYEETITYNYCYFNNRINNTEQKRYFCYITNYQYVEPNITRINIAVDTLQTFFFDIDKLRGNLNRCHAPRRINLGTTEAPKYIINPDLYFMEDEVDTYRPVETYKAPNPHQTYIVLTYALPSTYKSVAGSYSEEEGFVNPLGVYLDKETEIAVRDKNKNTPETMSVKGRINFPLSSSYKIDIGGISLADENVVERFNYSTKDIGDTSLYVIILPTAPYTSENIDFLPYETFKEMFPLLQDKLVDSFYVDSVDEVSFIKTMDIQTGSASNLSTSYNYYSVPYTRLQAFKKLVNIDSTNNINPDKWVNRTNDNLTIRKIDQEKKLDLYPYSFVKVSSMGSELVWKYQEFYKILPVYNDVCYSFVKAYNVVSPNYKMLSTLLFDKDKLINYNDETFVNLINSSSLNVCNYFTILEGQELLPSLSIYQEKYTEYLNYQKAIVDANNVMNFAGGIVGGGLDVASSYSKMRHDTDIENRGFAFARRNSGTNKDYDLAVDLHHAKQRAIAGKGTWGIGGAIVGGLTGIGNFITTALQEQALKKQPMNVLHNGTSSDKLYSVLYDFNGNIYDYVITRYDVIDNIKSVYEQKFYNYGYSIPVDVELYWDDLINIIANRKYFCFMEWNSLELECNIPTIYMNDMISRLCSGVRFENTSNTLLFQSYTINDNNKETELPAKPFFVREY